MKIYQILPFISIFFCPASSFGAVGDVFSLGDDLYRLRRSSALMVGTVIEARDDILPDLDMRPSINIGSSTTRFHKIFVGEVVATSATFTTLLFPAGSTDYIQVRDTLQSGTTFYVASGTINGQAIFALSSGNVGIGVNVTSSVIHVSNSDNSTTAGQGRAALRISNASGTGDSLREIQFTGQGRSNLMGSISMLNTSSSADGALGDLAFYGKSSLTTQSLTELLRIKSDGNVGISTNSPTALLHLSGSSVVGSGQTTSPIGLLFSNKSGAGGVGGTILFSAQDFGAAYTYAAISSSNTSSAAGVGAVGNLVFATKANQTDTSLTPRMAITSGGLVVITSAASPTTTSSLEIKQPTDNRAGGFSLQAATSTASCSFYVRSACATGDFVISTGTTVRACLRCD